MNLQLDDVALFLRVLTLGTLSAAAREREVPVSQISRALQRLEACCGAALMRRSTHGLSLTDEGEAFVPQARRLLEIQGELQAELAGKRAGPSGWVRVSTSAVLAQALIAPSLPALQARHPALHLDISAEDRLVDMVRERIDIAIRTGTPASETVVARQIGALVRGLYAAPSYLDRHGRPRHPDELAGHQLVSSSDTPLLNDWTWREPGAERGAAREQHLDVRGTTRVDSTAALVALVQAGAGISRLSDLAARPLLRAGLIEPVLPEHFQTAPVPVYAVMLRDRHRLPKLRACVEHWAQWLAQG